MATYNPKRLTNPNIIRSIDPTRLLDLLQSHRDYLRDRGLPLPSARKAASLDLDRLAEILMTPTEKTPQSLLNAIFLIDELATPAGMDALLAAAQRAGMTLDETKEHSPADVAVQVWLFSPAIVEDQHAWQTWKMPRKLECFQSAEHSRAEPIAFTPERIERAEMELNDWLAGKNRGRGARLFLNQVGREMHCSLRRGEPFRREQAITEDGVEYYHYRPAKYDTVIFSFDDTELRINTPMKAAACHLLPRLWHSVVR